jgi:hypothetical protein
LFEKHFRRERSQCARPDVLRDSIPRPATQKSAGFDRLYSSMRMLPGLMSRCEMFCEWQSSSALNSCESQLVMERELIPRSVRRDEGDRTIPTKLNKFHANFVTFHQVSPIFISFHQFSPMRETNFSNNKQDFDELYCYIIR